MVACVVDVKLHRQLLIHLLMVLLIPLLMQLLVSCSEVLNIIFFTFGIREGQKSQIISFILEAGNQNGHGNGIL